MQWIRITQASSLVLSYFFEKLRTFYKSFVISDTTSICKFSLPTKNLANFSNTAKRPGITIKTALKTYGPSPIELAKN